MHIIRYKHYNEWSMQYLQCYSVLSYMIVLLAKFINTTIVAGVDLSNIVLTASKHGSRVDLTVNLR